MLGLSVGRFDMDVLLYPEEGQKGSTPSLAKMAIRIKKSPHKQTGMPTHGCLYRDDMPIIKRTAAAASIYRSLPAIICLKNTMTFPNSPLPTGTSDQ
jgi:hypothetical protein